MKKIFIIFSTALLLASCVSFEKFKSIDLSNKNKVGESAVTYNLGHYVGEDCNWTGSVKQSEENLIVAKDGRGAFAELVVPSLDFRGKVALVVRAKTTSTKSPKLRVALLDKENSIANGRDLTQVIQKSDGFVEYVYFLEGSFTQLSPEIKKVHASDIRKIRLYPLGAENNDIEIEDISVVLAASTQKTKKNTETGKEAGLLTQFASVKEFKAITGTGNGLEVERAKKAIKLVCKDVGPAYQSIVIDIDKTDFTKHQIVKIRAKCKIEPGQRAPYLRLDLLDDRGNVTNKQPVWRLIDGKSENKVTGASNGASETGADGVVQLEEVVLSVDGTYYVDYYYDFSRRFLQSYPSQVLVDMKRIEKLKIYVNPGYNRFKGEIFIDKIEVL